MTETLHDITEAEHLRACDQRQDARYAEDRYEDGYWDQKLHSRMNGDTPERLKRENVLYTNRPGRNYIQDAKDAKKFRLHRSAAVIIGAVLGLALAHVPLSAHNPRTTAALLVYVLINVMVCGFFRAASRD